MPRRARKQYRRPKKPFDKLRIDEERAIMRKYGLRKKREIWRAAYQIDRIRAQAKALILRPEAQPQFFARLQKLGLIKQGATLDDVLGLTKEALLERRLQTLVFRQGLAATPKEARQLIVHRKIKIGDEIVNIPSYLVSVDEEQKIKRIK